MSPTIRKNAMKVTINGNVHNLQSVTNSLSLASLVEQLGHHPKLVVVEFNGEILPPQNWELQKVQNGDSLEIVTIVGGGSYSYRNCQ